MDKDMVDVPEIEDQEEADNTVDVDGPTDQINSVEVWNLLMTIKCC